MYLNFVHIKQLKHVLPLIDTFADFRHHRRPETFDSSNQIMTILGICLTIGYVAVGTFAMIAFGVMKCEEGTQDGCGLIMPVYYPYVDTDFGVGRYAVQVVQVIGGFGCAICTFVISWIYITHSEFLNTYMDQLKVMLAAIAKDPDFYRRRWRFRECVMYHQRILE